MLDICGDQEDAITEVLSRFTDENFNELAWDVEDAKSSLKAFTGTNKVWSEAEVVLCT